MGQAVVHQHLISLTLVAQTHPAPMPILEHPMCMACLGGGADVGMVYPIHGATVLYAPRIRWEQGGGIDRSDVQTHIRFLRKRNSLEQAAFQLRRV